jgi:hypothetical protein
MLGLCDFYCRGRTSVYSGQVCVAVVLFFTGSNGAPALLTHQDGCVAVRLSTSQLQTLTSGEEPHTVCAFILVSLSLSTAWIRAPRSTNMTAEALGSIRLVTTNFSAEMWQNMNVSVSEMITTTAQDAFINARDTIDASATDMSLGAGDTVDVVAQNKASVLTTDFWLAAGHALDIFAQVCCCVIFCQA